MNVPEIHEEVERICGPVAKSALSSTLSRLRKEHRIRRPKPGRYASVIGKNVSEEAATHREDSIPNIAYTILRNAGKPLTDDEIWSLAKTVKPDIKRSSVRGSLYGNAKIGRLFKLIPEKTFALLEWQNHREEHPQALADTEVAQPGEDLVFRESAEEGSVAGQLDLKNHGE
jgi:hypothetical protein